MERIAKGFILATTLLLPTYLLRFSILGIPTTLLELLIIASFLATAITTRGTWRFPPRPVLIATILFVLSAVISTVIAPDKLVALGILKAWIGDPILFAWAIYQFSGQQGFIRALLTLLVASGVVVSLSAIWQKLSGQTTLDGRVLGLYGWFPEENASPNYLALYLAPLGVVASGLAADHLLSKRWTLGTAFAVAFGSILLALLFSLSRAGIAVLFIGIVAKDVFRLRSWIAARPLTKLALAAGLVLVVIGGWYAIRPDPGLAPEEGGRITASNNVRWEIWRTTVREIIPAHPVLGVGLGNFQNYFTELTQGRVNYDRIAPLALTPHNLFLSLWVNLGLLGLLALVWLLFDVFRASWRRLRGVLKPSEVWLGATLLGALVALLAHGLLDTPYFKNDFSVLFWTLVILLVSWSGGQTSRERKRKG